MHYTTSCNTQSSAPEDGQNNCPKHVEQTGIINKPLLLHLVGCLYYLYYFFFRLAKQSQFIPLQNVVYFITLAFLVLKIFTFYINDVLLFKCPFPGPKVNRTAIPLFFHLGPEPTGGFPGARKFRPRRLNNRDYLLSERQSGGKRKSPTNVSP